MLVRVNDRPLRPIVITIDGAPFEAKAGDSVAVALLEAGHVATRVSAVSAAPRGAYCLMGVCFECLVQIDGVDNRQGCLVEVREGMAIETRKAQREEGR
jgi:predicted molibdopterin-dependent oxidoreductase YjgC